MPGINQLGGAQTLAHADTSARETQPLSIEAALGAKGQQDSPADGVKPPEETSEARHTDEDGRNQREQKRSFAALARMRRRPDPYTGDLLSLRSSTETSLSSPRLSLVALGESRTAKQQLEHAMNDIFARPASKSSAPVALPEPEESKDRRAEQAQFVEVVDEHSAEHSAELEKEVELA